MVSPSGSAGGVAGAGFETGASSIFGGSSSAFGESSSARTPAVAVSRRTVNVKRNESLEDFMIGVYSWLNFPFYLSCAIGRSALENDDLQPVKPSNGLRA